MPVGSRTPGRHLAAARGGWGLVLVTCPDRVLSQLTGDGGSPLGAGLLRVLGARHIVQAGVTALAPTRAVLAAGAVADGLHVATAVLFGRADRRQRRAGLIAAGIAGAFGVASARAASR